jgi:ketosteroid isomerase-like protein
MSPAHPNEDLVRRFYDARARDDRDEIRRLVSAGVAWHDPYPPPHGGDLTGLDAVLEQIFDAAREITGGSTRLRIHDVVANDHHAVALVEWSSSIPGKGSIEGREVALYHVENGVITEAWFYPEEPQRYSEFFA